MQKNVAAAWRRLQACSEEHARRIGPQMKGWGKKQQHVPHPEISDNCEILGRGDEEEIKSRLYWYITFHPEVFAVTRNKA